MDDMEPVFKALADPNRRLLLDRLHKRDGQTLLALQGALPMTRFGVMKHLKVLEDAGLIATKRIGREKFHYLNPIPIQQLYDRWVSKYARPWARALTGLKYALEEDLPVAETAVATTPLMMQIYIRTSPERLWQALTDGEFTKHYYYGGAVHSDWLLGSPVRYVSPAGELMLDGEVLEIDPPRKLVTTFVARWAAQEQQIPSRVTYEIEPKGEVCKLIVTHDEISDDLAKSLGVVDGWSHILSGLKTYLETGHPLLIEP